MACFFWIQWFLDRWYQSDRTAIFPGKRVILTIPFEDTTAAAPRHTVGILTEALNYVGAEVVATVLAPGVHRRGEVSQRTDQMGPAHHAGLYL
jgi:hypothetical protein